MAATTDFDHEPRGRDFADFGLELVLYDLRSPINTGMILRIAEAFEAKVWTFDFAGLFEDEQKRQTVSDFSCGALARRGVRRSTDPADLDRPRDGRRLIGTSIGPGARPLAEFTFRPGDLVLFGNEYDGLPGPVEAMADQLVSIPMPARSMPKPVNLNPIDPDRVRPVAREGQPSLNVAVTAGILCQEAYARWCAGRG